VESFCEKPRADSGLINEIPNGVSLEEADAAILAYLMSTHLVKANHHLLEIAFMLIVVLSLVISLY
jgi:hypothetical protein